MMDKMSERVSRGLDRFEIELPSWGFANTGTRFGKYIQPAAATNIDEKFSDAAQVHAVTGVCPSLALHVVWDFPQGVDSTESIKKIAGKTGVRPGAILLNVLTTSKVLVLVALSLAALLWARPPESAGTRHAASDAARVRDPAYDLYRP